MVCHLFVHEVFLLALLWQLVFSYWTWKRGQATKHPPTQQPKRLPQTPKPFAGLTHKPLCEGCEHDQAHRDPCSSPNRDARARSLLISITVPSKYVPIMDGWAAAISTRMGIRGAGRGASCSVWYVRRTFWKPGARCFRAKECRPNCWCG